MKTNEREIVFDRLSERIRNPLKKKFNFTEDELDKAIQDGRLCLVARKMDRPKDTSVTVEPSFTYVREERNA